jgi:hypothetical protein
MSLKARLRQTADHIETALLEVESIVQDLPSEPGRGGETAHTTTVLELAHRDLVSAQALLFRVSLARAGVIQRILGAILGRTLPSSNGDGAESDCRLDASTASGIALDPFRAHLADSALDVDRLFKSLSAIRTSMADFEIETDIDLPDWPDPVINFAAGMVDGALECLGDARTLLFGAADLTEDRLVHISAERMVGTDKRSGESMRRRA